MFPCLCDPNSLSVVSTHMKKHLALADFVEADFSKERNLPKGNNVLGHLMTLILVLQDDICRSVWWLWVWGL